MASGSETEGCGHRPYGCDCRAFGGRAGARAGCLNRKRRRHNRCRSGAAGGRPANLNNPERKRLPERMFRFGRDTGPDVAVSAADAAEKCATEDIFPVAFLFYHKFSYLWDVNVCNPTAYGDP